MRNFSERRSRVARKKLPRKNEEVVMNVVHTALEGGGSLASFGSGDSAASGGRAGRRARGRAGRQIAPAGATRALLAAARRQAGTPGRGRRSRQSLLDEIVAAATRARGGSRLTNRQVADLRARLGR